jgi:small-conductance mechanosensitive channel
MVRQAIVVIVFSSVVVGIASGQAQRPPATLDDLVTEVRAMRAEMNRAAAASVQAQLLAARMTVHELRLSTAGQQLANARQQLAESHIRMSPYLEQLKAAPDRKSEILEPLRRTVHLEEQRNQELRDAEAQLMRLIEAGEGRSNEFNARLADLEQALSRVR